MKRLRMPYSKLKQIVVDCDSNQLTAEMCTSLIGMAPTADEVALVKDYDGDVSNLMETEQFFLEVSSVPRMVERLKCLSTTFTFHESLEQVLGKQELVVKASALLKNNNKFRTVVSIVLALGNYLNGGTRKGQWW